MTAIAMDVRELSFDELDRVSGAKPPVGFWQSLGKAFDNPFETLGFIVDSSSGSLEGAWATGKIGNP